MCRNLQLPGAAVTELIIALLAMGACVYGGSAAAKLRSQRAYRSFRAGLAETALVPRRRLAAVAAILTGCEVAVAVGMASGAALAVTSARGAIVVAESAFGGALALTVVLAAGIAMVMRRGTRARCACFGSRSARPLGGAHLIRNAGLGVLLAVGLAGEVGEAGEAIRHGQESLAGSALAVVAGVIAGIVLIHLDDLIALFTPVSAAHAARPVSPVSAARAFSPASTSANAACAESPASSARAVSPTRAVSPASTSASSGQQIPPARPDRVAG